MRSVVRSLYQENSKQVNTISNKMIGSTNSIYDRMLRLFLLRVDGLAKVHYSRMI